METKSFTAVELKAAARGEFSALIASFNVPDKRNDVIRKGAFSESIARWRSTGDPVPVIYAHQDHDPHMFIGTVQPDDLRETAIGLEATGKLDLDDPQGLKVFKSLQARTLKEWSFAYVVRRARNLADGMRELLAVDLLELGPCLVGCGTTATIATKSAKTDEPLVGVLAPYRNRLDLMMRRIELETVLARGR